MDSSYLNALTSTMTPPIIRHYRAQKGSASTDIALAPEYDYLHNTDEELLDDFSYDGDSEHHGVLDNVNGVTTGLTSRVSYGATAERKEQSPVMTRSDDFGGNNFGSAFAVDEHGIVISDDEIGSGDDGPFSGDTIDLSENARVQLFIREESSARVESSDREDAPEYESEQDEESQHDAESEHDEESVHHEDSEPDHDEESHSDADVPGYDGAIGRPRPVDEIVTKLISVLETLDTITLTDPSVPTAEASSMILGVLHLMMRN